MAYNGTGGWNRLYNWQNDAANNIKIRADRMDNETNDMCNNGLGAVVTRDGQGSASADQPMNTFKHTNVGNALARTQYAAAGQIQDGGLVYAVAGGTADALTASFTPAIPALVDGMLLRVKAILANATTVPAIAIDANAAKTITKFGGLPLAPGDIRGPGHELILQYSSTGTRIELLNPFAGSVYMGSVLLVGGGGGGGVSTSAVGGGGGGNGGVVSGQIALLGGATYVVTVGTGGASHINGVNSVAFGYTAFGGCRGGQTEENGISGPAGGGGGGASGVSNHPGGNSNYIQGYPGGANGVIGSPYPAGGGGGAAAAGADGSSQGGNGGAGLASTITGASVTYGGGGGGGIISGNTPGAGGAGGGGAGSSTGAGTAGTANTGGGGGGGSGNAAGGTGGSGVVILSVPTANYSGVTTGAPTITTSGGNTIIKFTASGSYTA